MRKGDIVIIDHVKLSQREDPIKKMLGKHYNPAVHNRGDRTPEIIQRSKNGDFPKITQIVNDGYYLNLVYNDGFECGISTDYIKSVKKV